MPKIRPIKDLRNTTEISSLCHQLDEPIFITKNGYGDMVIMSMETYEKMLTRVEIYDKLKVAEEQLEYTSDLIEGRDALKELRNKHVKK